jgi:hypothetical protein
LRQPASIGASGGGVSDADNDPLYLLASLAGRACKNGGKRASKNREMKEEPKISLITKGRFGEPTMLMKTNEIAGLTHDVYENKLVNLKVQTPGFSVGLAAFQR